MSPSRCSAWAVNPGWRCEDSTEQSAQAPRIIVPTQQQTSATHRVVGPGAMTDDSSLCLALEELLGLPHPAQRFLALAELRQRPSREGDRPGKKHGDISAAKHHDPAARATERAFAQSCLRRWRMLAAKWAQLMLYACWVASASWVASAWYLAASANRAEVGEAHDQPGATEDRWRHGQAEIFVGPLGGQRGEVLGARSRPRARTHLDSSAPPRDSSS